MLEEKLATILLGNEVFHTRWIYLELRQNFRLEQIKIMQVKLNEIERKSGRKKGKKIRKRQNKRIRQRELSNSIQCRCIQLGVPWAHQKWEVS